MQKEADESDLWLTYGSSDCAVPEMTLSYYCSERELPEHRPSAWTIPLE